MLATGEVLEIDANQDPDLFWACRGATGGTFGVHTSFTFQLVEAPQEVAYFRYDYRGADAAAVIFAESQKLNATAPAALNANMMARAAPVGAGGPREAIDVLIRGQYIGPIDELQDLLAPMLAAAPETSKPASLEVLPFWQVQTGDLGRCVARAAPVRRHLPLRQGSAARRRQRQDHRPARRLPRAHRDVERVGVVDRLGRR